MKNVHLIPTDKPSHLHSWRDENSSTLELCELEYSHTTNTKQSAVEWYSEEHWKLFLQLESKEITPSEYTVEHQILLVEAKELEKQQRQKTIEEAFELLN